jgi:MFS family permease
LLHGVCYDFFFVVGFIYTDRVAGEKVKGQAQSMIVMFTYGIGMLLGSQISGALYNHLVAGQSVPQAWVTFWWIPAVAAAVIALIFLFSFSTTRKGVIFRRGMKTIKGPGIFLAQFIGAQAPFNTLDGLAGGPPAWAIRHCRSLQPSGDFDVERAARARPTAMRSRQAGGAWAGHQRAVHPSGRATGGGASGVCAAFDAFAPAALRGNRTARQALGGGEVARRRWPRPA